MPSRFSVSALLKKHAPVYVEADMREIGEIFTLTELKDFWRVKMVEDGFFADEAESEHYDQVAQTKMVMRDLSRLGEAAKQVDPFKLETVLGIKESLDKLSFRGKTLDEKFEAIKAFYQKKFSLRQGELEFYVKSFIDELQKVMSRLP
ncbi:MAG: hypothetical protein KGJ93_00825 [Patescibacteria group bacterium]|nr:hypothetical protein [Patescibacteria group bacterium]